MELENNWPTNFFNLKSSKGFKESAWLLGPKVDVSINSLAAHPWEWDWCQAIQDELDHTLNGTSYYY